jgi:hypothetical protein
MAVGALIRRDIEALVSRPNQLRKRCHPAPKGGIGFLARRGTVAKRCRQRSSIPTTSKSADEFDFAEGDRTLLCAAQ